MNEQAIYHKAKSSFAYAVSSNTIHVRIATAAGDFDKAVLVFGDKYCWQHKQEKDMELILSDRLNDYYQADVYMESKRFSYYFKLFKGDRFYYFSDCGLTEDMYEDSFEEYFFHFPYINEMDMHKIPEWWIDNTACYHIFPDRFYNGRPETSPENIEPWGSEPTLSNFMGGDIPGISDKIEYLKDLGITTIYMTPFFKSHSNHKYDIIDFFKVDPHFGTDQDLKNLVQKAHENGIKVVIDAVFNHSSTDFFAFQDVVKNGEKSRYRDWFFVKEYPIDLEKIFRAYKENTYGNGIDALRQDWFYDRDTGNNLLCYECFWSDPNMPKLNTANPETKDYLIKAGVYWVKEFDVDGWRLDVPNEIDHVFWRDFRIEVKKVKPDTLLLGEIWDNGEPWLRGDQFDNVMNYGLRRALRDYIAINNIGKKDFIMLINRLLMRTTDIVNQAMLNFLDTHDTERYLTTLDGNIDKLIMNLGVIYTFVGVPMIYYGTEIGMTGLIDPGCRKCMDWNSSNWKMKIFNSVKKLGRIRRSEYVLRYGKFRWIELHKDLVAYERFTLNDSILIIINNSDRTINFSLPEKFKGSSDIFNTSQNSDIIEKFGFKIVKKK